jgi:putative transposase
MCKCLRVLRNGYYNWIVKSNTRKTESIATKALTDKVVSIFNSSFSTYGTRRIKHMLYSSYSLIVSRKRIGKLMKTANIAVKSRFRHGFTQQSLCW